MDKKYLIVNADDFGQSPEVNNGIIRSFEEGIVTSTSFMVRYPSATEAADYARRKKFDLGLHVDLGEWRLQNEDWLPIYKVVNLDNLQAVEDEIHSQLEKFLRLTGKNPSHIDSHQHVHMRKELTPVFMNLAKKLNVPLRQCTGDIKYCGDFYGQNSDGSPNDSITEDGLKKTLRSIGTGITELACHPGIKIKLNTLYKNERDLEVRTLCSENIRSLIEVEKIRLVTFADKLR